MPTTDPRATIHCPAATPTVLMPNPGGLVCTVTVLTAGSAAGTIYDNSSAASGNKLLVIPANTVAGTIYKPEARCALGAYYDGITNAPEISVSIG
jgi:hypothetical protein